MRQLEIEKKFGSPQETRAFASQLAACLHDSLVIALTGELGAGKTTFVQGIAQALKVKENVSSPSFLMLNEYDSGRMPVYHFDLYRLQEDLDFDSAAAINLKADLDEFMQLGRLSGRPRLALVEWSNLWPEFFSEYDCIEIVISYGQESDSSRRFVLKSRGKIAEKVLESLCRDLPEAETE